MAISTNPEEREETSAGEGELPTDPLLSMESKESPLAKTKAEEEKEVEENEENDASMNGKTDAPVRKNDDSLASPRIPGTSLSPQDRMDSLMIEPHRNRHIQHQDTQDSDCIQAPSSAPLVKSKTISCGSSLNTRNLEHRINRGPLRNKPDVLQELSFKVPSQPLIAQPGFSTSFVGNTRPSSPSYDRIGNRYKRSPTRAASEFIPGLACRGSRTMLRNDSKASYKSASPSGGFRGNSLTGSVDMHEYNFKSNASIDISAGIGSMRDKQNQAHASYRLGFRRSLFEKRKQLCDLALFLAALGIVLMVVDNELFTFHTKYSSDESNDKYWDSVLILLKSGISLTTLMLVGSIIAYHAREIQLFMVDNCVDDWQIALTGDRIAQIAAEIIVCSIHTPPISNLNEDHVTIHLLLSTLMFSRLYLIGRAMLLHSKLFTDASSRSIGALNRINFNTRFVIKTLMTICPGSVLMVLTVSLWFILSWVMRICEQSAPEEGGRPRLGTFLDSMYLVGITFFAIGYGDYFPLTYCGRGVSITCGLMGAGCTAMVVAVLARKLELSRAEKHVHNFMMDNQLSKRLKCAAANVLRETWFIYKNTKLSSKLNHRVIRKHQRLFLSAIHTLRKTKIDQRKLFDQANQMVDLAKTQEIISQIYERMQENNDTMESRMNIIEQKLEALHSSLGQLSSHFLTLANENNYGLYSVGDMQRGSNDGTLSATVDEKGAASNTGAAAHPLTSQILPPMIYKPTSTATRTRSLMRRPRVVSSRQSSDVSETTA